MLFNTQETFVVDICQNTLTNMIGDSNKYPQQMFLGVNNKNKKKKVSSIPVILLYVGVLCSSKYILMGENWGTNIITRVLCSRNTVKSHY